MYQKAYRLAPDRRFIVAISEIRKFFPSRKEETVQAEFTNGNWRISYGNEEIGKIPEFSDFPDFLNVLTAWAKRLNEKDPISFANTKEGGDSGIGIQRIIADTNTNQNFGEGR